MRITTRNGLIGIAALAVSVFFAGCATTEEQADPSLPAPAPIAEPAVPEQIRISGVPTLQEAAENERAARDFERRENGARSARSIAQQAERYGAELIHREGSKEWQLRKGNRLLTLTESSRSAIVDGVGVFLDRPFGQFKGRWLLSESDESLLLESLFGEVPAEARRVRTIVLDPGHGGAEEGTKNESLGLMEKTLNLDVCERLKTHLEALGYRVALTRYDDRLVSLEDRPKLAGSVGADLFVSVHFNAAINKEARGLETYMLTPAGQPSTSSSIAGDDAVPYPGNGFDRNNFELAFRIQKAMVGALQRDDRGVRKGRFAVLRSLECPGVLVECGFLSNVEEAQLVGTPVYREKLARTLSDAIDAYARSRPLAEL